MAKDYTKYSVEGVGENLSKSGLVNAVVTHYAKKNKCDFPTLLKTFPDELQGKRFVVKKLSEAKADSKKYEGRYFTKDPIKLSDKEVVVVCNQWGSDNIQPFIDRAESLGYSVEAISRESNPMTEIVDEKWNEEMLAFAIEELDNLTPEFKAAREAFQQLEQSKRPDPIYGLHTISYFYIMLTHGADSYISEEEFELYCEKLSEWHDDQEFVENIHTETSEWYNSMSSAEEKSFYLQQLIPIAKELFSFKQLKVMIIELISLANADGDISTNENKFIDYMMDAFDISIDDFT